MFIGGGILHKGKFTPPFVPTSLTGCKLWLRSDLGITLNGSNVTTWADQSGNSNNFTQSTDSRRPDYFSSGGANNMPYVSSTPSNTDILTGSGSLVTSGTFTTCIVFRSRSTNLDRPIFTTGGGGNGGGVTYRSTPQGYESDIVNAKLFFDGDVGSAGSSRNRGTVPEIWIHRWTGDQHKLNINGEAETVSGAQQPINGGSATLFGDANLGQYSDSDIYEVIFYNNDIGLTNETNVFNYLNTRYAISTTAIVPTDISGCKAWLRSDLGVSLSGSDVTQWNDQSGSGNHFISDSGSRPTYVSSGGPNDVPTITTAASTSQKLYKAISNINVGYGLTMIMAFKFNSTSPTNRTPLYVGSFNFDGTGLYFDSTGKQSLRIHDNDTTPVNLVGDTAATTANKIWVYRAKQINGNLEVLLVNNVNQNVTNSTVTPWGGHNTTVTLSGTSGGYTNAGDLTCYEAIVYKGDIGAAYATRIYNYMSTRYGI